MKSRILLLSILLVPATIAHCQEIDEEDYRASFALYEEAKLLIEEGNLDQAVDFLQQAHEFNKGNTDFTYVAAFALFKQKDYPAALKKIGWSLALEPFQSDYLVLAGNISFRAKQYEKSVGYYSKALQYQDSSEVPINELRCLYNRGTCYLNLKEYEAAVKDFSLVIDTDDENYMAYHNRGLAHINLRQGSEGCSDLQKAIDLGSPISEKYQNKYCEEP